MAQKILIQGYTPRTKNLNKFCGYISKFFSKTKQLPSPKGKKEIPKLYHFPCGSTHREANDKCKIPSTLMNGQLTITFLSHMHLRAMLSQCNNQATHNKKLRIIKCYELTITSYFHFQQLLPPYLLYVRGFIQHFKESFNNYLEIPSK